MTWTVQSFSVGQVLTAAQMNNLNDNITALANGDSGAPNIQTAGLASGAVTTGKIAASAVGRSEIANSSASSGGSELNSGANINMSNWSLFPMIYGQTPGEWTMRPHGTNNTISEPQFRLDHSGGSSRNYSVEWRRIDAA